MRMVIGAKYRALIGGIEGIAILREINPSFSMKHKFEFILDGEKYSCWWVHDDDLSYLDCQVLLCRWFEKNGLKKKRKVSIGNYLLKKIS